MNAQKKKGISIRMKLIGIIIPIVLFIIIMFFALSRSMVEKISMENLQAKSQVYAGEISAWTGEIFSELQVYQDAIEEGNFADDAAVLKYMETTVDKNASYPLGLYMGDDSGVYLDGSGWVPDSDWVLVERDWYLEGKEREKLAFGEPYYDSLTGQVCVSASVRVNYEKAVRVLATDVYLDDVSGLIADISAQDEIDAFLVTQGSQTIIAHPDTEMMALNLGTEGLDPLYAGVGAALSQSQDGIQKLQGKDDRYYVSINPVEHTDWYLVTYMTESEVLSDLHKMELIMLLIAAVGTVLLIFGTLRVTGGVVKPVAKVTDVIGRIAEGDFSENLEVKGNDEIARMSRDMQMFISRMRSTISEISATADWLNKQSAENEQVSDSLLESSQSQAGAMELLGQMVDKLSTAAENVSEQMEQLAGLIESARNEGEMADVLMKESVDMSQNGKQGMEQIDKGMQDVTASITSLSRQIDRAGTATAQIGEMVNMIMEIAEETNLLSLNASIEAARAGEAGRGFAIVAEQIGKLAANSSAAADDISRLTADIQGTVSEAVTFMNASVDEVQNCTAIVTRASEIFTNLYQKVEETSDRVASMIELVGQVDTVSGEMKKITESQVQATEHIVDSARTMDQHTKNVVKNSSTVAQNAEQLKKESTELSGKMSKFKL